MLNGKFMRGAGMVTLFLFVFFTFSTAIAQAKDEDVLTKAQKLYQEGDYEGSINMLSKFIEKLKAMVEQKKNGDFIIFIFKKYG